MKINPFDHSRLITAAALLCVITALGLLTFLLGVTVAGSRAAKVCDTTQEFTQLRGSGDVTYTCSRKTFH